MAATLPARIDEALRVPVEARRGAPGARRGALAFGSYSRGDWRPESDVDVLVVLDHAVGRNRREVFDLARKTCSSTRGSPRLRSSLQAGASSGEH